MNAYVIKNGVRWSVVVTHPEEPRYEISCPTKERADEVAHLIRSGRYTH